MERVNDILMGIYRATLGVPVLTSKEDRGRYHIFRYSYPNHSDFYSIVNMMVIDFGFKVMYNDGMVCWLAKEEDLIDMNITFEGDFSIGISDDKETYEKGMERGKECYEMV